ncbi:MAG: SMC-Scp complex subunit ScpB [Eggerthellaceae bacterium]|nr:SMC-Scp complex subunit ScpB [Eggerthellaceae bacterium]
MFSGLEEKQLKGALEALLFVTDEPVNTIALADMLDIEPSEVEIALVDLRSQLEDENRGIQLREVAGGWRLYTHPAFHELIEEYVVSWDTRRLSQAAIETLAIIAYSQPITRMRIASVRGVNSDSPINSLVEKGLVREAGTEEGPGNPMLFATTRSFLEKFGLRSIEDLPDIESFAPDEELRAFIRERLSAVRSKGSAFDEEAGRDEEGGFFAVGGQTLGPFGEPEPSASPSGSAQGPSGEALGDDTEPLSAQRSLLAQALSAGLGAVEKIDFDGLEFEE